MTKLRHTRHGSPYRCQSKIAYLALQVLELLLGLFTGATGISNGRWYRVAAQLPYEGKVSLKCQSKLNYRIDVSRVVDKSPWLQKELLDSYMDFSASAGTAPAVHLQLQMALLPTLCAIEDSFPEISVTPGQCISVQITKITGWDIPEEMVDSLYPELMLEAHRFHSCLRSIESGFTSAPGL